MLETKSKVEEDNKILSNRTYVKQQFFGPYLDFIEIESEKDVTIKLGRSYSEDSKYSNSTRLQLAVELLHEVIQEQKKPVFLRIWGDRIDFSNIKDEAGIYKNLSDFILRNVTF